MTDAQNSLLHKKRDLKFYYEMAQEAFQANDVNEALKISQNALQIAQSQNESKWVQIFDSFNSQLHQKVPLLASSPIKENLTGIKGIGVKVAERLINAGIKTINDLAHTSVQKLASLEGIGKATAQRFIDSAKERLHMKKLNGFSGRSQIKLGDSFNSKKSFKESKQVDLDYSESIKINSHERMPNYILTLSPSTPIVVDGSNIAWMGGDKKKGDIPELKYLIELREYLINIGFKEITIFCDFGLPYIIDERKKLEDLIQKKIIYRALKEGKEVDDHYVLQYAKKVNGYFIVESEKYSNWFNRGYDEDWIKERRITARYVKGEFLLKPIIEITEDFKDLKSESIKVDKNVDYEEIHEIDIPEKIHENNPPKSFPWFDGKYNYSRLGKSYPRGQGLKIIEQDEDFNESDIEEISNDLEEISGDIKDDVKQDSADGSLAIQSEILRQKNFELIERAKVSKKILNHSQIKDITTEISKELELSEFFIVKPIQELRTILTGIDLLAIRLTKVHEFLDLIFIVPIKICMLTESLIVSDTTMRYHSVENIPENDYHLEKLLQSYLQALSNCGQLVYEDIGKEGALFRYITKYLHLDISLEKTFTHKNLFFRSGPLQFKILAEPILVSQSKVGFTEKLIPFAYQKNSNIHVVEIFHLSDLLQYLDQKYFLVETYSKKESSLALYCKASNKFMEDLRRISAPFMIYGVIFLFIFLFQEDFLLFWLVNLGYGVIAFYTLIVGYLYIRFYQHKVGLQKEFSTPYFKKTFDFDDTDLILIREELSKPFMAQFTYEMLGKNPNSKVISELEKYNAETYLKTKEKEKKERENNSISKLFEPKTQPKNSELKNKLVEKYSSFLED
ncbi:MAG: helix-hairpin-helix domain-containing protein [Promethearchaeota archaeon]